MATATGTNVKFVKVQTKQQYTDYTDKDGALIFVESERKIYVDGIAYGFSDSDVANKFLELTGGTLTGALTIGGTAVKNTVIGDESIKFNHTNIGNSEIKRSSGALNGLEIVVGDTTFSFKAGNFFGAQGEDQDPVRIGGVADPVSGNDAVNKWYLDHHVINKIGENGGIASLDNTGKVPSEQLPSYVDDVLEYSAKASFPDPDDAETGKLYVDLSNNRVYRWGGSAYVNVSDGNAHLTLGDSSSTAYRGDHGLIAYQHTSKTNNPHSVTATQVGLGNVQNYGQASITEAEDGTSDNKYMTPLTTKYAVQEFAPRLSWEVVS